MQIHVQQRKGFWKAWGDDLPDFQTCAETAIAWFTSYPPGGIMDKQLHTEHLKFVDGDNEEIITQEGLMKDSRYSRPQTKEEAIEEQHRFSNPFKQDRFKK